MRCTPSERMRDEREAPIVPRMDEIAGDGGASTRMPNQPSRYGLSRALQRHAALDQASEFVE